MVTDAEREKLYDVYVERWTAIGLCTEPADRPRAERAILKAYANAKEPVPRIAWALSPQAMKQGGPDFPPVGSGDICFGSHDAGWMARYAFVREVEGKVEETEEVVPFIELAQSCGWVGILDGVAVLCERHNVLRLDVEGRAHCLDGPAIAYPDGWGAYCVRGVNVPKEWVEGRGTLDVKLALTHPNIEQRAAAAELIGWDRVIRELSPKVIDEEHTPEYDFGVLLEAELPDLGRQRFLQVRCPTGRTMVILASNEARTAREANAMSYGYDVGKFLPEGRT